MGAVVRLARARVPCPGSRTAAKPLAGGEATRVSIILSTAASKEARGMKCSVEIAISACA